MGIWAQYLNTHFSWIICFAQKDRFLVFHREQILWSCTLRASLRLYVITQWRLRPRMQSGKQTWKRQVKTSLQTESGICFSVAALCLTYLVHRVVIYQPGVAVRSTAFGATVRVKLLLSRGGRKWLTCAGLSGFDQLPPSC